MSEKQKMLDDLQKRIRAIQGFPWSGISVYLDNPAGVATEIGCLVNAYQRVTLEGLKDLTPQELEEFLKLTEEVENLLIPLVKYIRNRYAIHHGDAIALKNLCQKALPTVREYADRVAATKARRKEADDLIADLEAKAKVIIADLEAKNKKATATVDGLAAPFQSRLNAFEGALAQLGVEKQADFFGEEADTHEEKAGTWLKGVWLAVAAFGGFALWTLLGSDKVDSGFALAQFLANRALVFITLGFGVFFCAQNYMAHRHNAVVNRHRQKALETYRALAEAGGEDSQTRDIVLTHAARCIYAQQDSGYTRGGNSGGGGDPVETIVRPVESIARKTGQGDK